MRYIHLNPLRAGMVADLDGLGSYPWSGHAVLLGKRAMEGQETDEVLTRFGKTRTGAVRGYLQFVADGIATGQRQDLVGGGLKRSQPAYSRIPGTVYSINITTLSATICPWHEWRELLQPASLTTSPSAAIAASRPSSVTTIIWNTSLSWPNGAENVGWKSGAWCLMPNHVHLIAVPSTEECLARAIGEAHRRYTRRINFRENWRGHLWQERFASFPMDERYLLAAARYVEMNPVAAGIVGHPEEYSGGFNNPTEKPSKKSIE